MKDEDLRHMKANRKKIVAGNLKFCSRTLKQKKQPIYARVDALCPQNGKKTPLPSSTISPPSTLIHSKILSLPLSPKESSLAHIRIYVYPCLYVCMGIVSSWISINKHFFFFFFEKRQEFVTETLKNSLRRNHFDYSINFFIIVSTLIF